MLSGYGNNSKRINAMMVIQGPKQTERNLGHKSSLHMLGGGKKGTREFFKENLVTSLD